VASAALPEWRQLAAAGRFQEAMQRAATDGFSGLCNSAPAADLLTLSEVARFARQSARAKEALLALRRRFHERPEASIAAFVLGRLAFDEDRDYPAAALWFKRYLDTSTEAPLSREAAGRLVEALAKARDHAAARTAARDYLDRYPDGPHAHFAAQVLNPGP
jgi:TolA-binding protein